MLKNQGSMVAFLLFVEKWNKVAERLQHLEFLLEAKQIEAEIASDPARLVTDEELERQIAAKIVPL